MYGTMQMTMNNYVTHGPNVLNETIQSLTNTTGAPVKRHENSTSAFHQPDSIFSKTTEQYLDIFVFGICGFSVSFAGVITNIINMITFYKYGLTRGMNLSFFALSFSDLAVAALYLTGTCGYLFDRIVPVSVIDPKSLGYLTMGSPRAMFLGISAFTTGLIALERCVCVIRPYKFKTIFTLRRCILILVIIYLFNLAAYLPMHLSAGLDWQLDPAVNKTRLMLKLYFSRRTIEMTSDIINGALVPTTIHVVVIASGIILISGLRRAAAKLRYSTSINFRMFANVATVSKINACIPRGYPDTISPHSSKFEGENGDNGHKLTASPVCESKNGKDDTGNGRSVECDSNVSASFPLNVFALRYQEDDKTHTSSTSSTSKDTNIRTPTVSCVGDEKSRIRNGEALTTLETPPTNTDDMNVAVHNRRIQTRHKNPRGVSMGTGKRELKSGTLRSGSRHSGASKAKDRARNNTIKRNPQQMSKKDAGLARMVAFIVVIHVTCATPGIVFAFARLFIQELDVNTRLEYLHNLLFIIVFILEGINGAVSLLVYYKANSNFRAILVHMCCSCRKPQQKPC